MSNNKQSSVEWLMEEYYSNLGRLSKTEFEQAKAMHKEEILSFESLLDEHEINALNNNTMLLTREEFYNQTYGGNK